MGICFFAGWLQANYYQSLNQMEVDSPKLNFLLF